MKLTIGYYVVEDDGYGYPYSSFELWVKACEKFAGPNATEADLRAVRLICETKRRHRIEEARAYGYEPVEIAEAMDCDTVMVVHPQEVRLQLPRRTPPLDT